MKSNRETAIFVLEKLIEQGGCSVDRTNVSTIEDGDGCLYRGPNEKRCAGGHLIPDDKYSPELEGKSVTHSSFINILKEYDINFVRVLQRFHDKKSLTITDEQKVESFKCLLEKIKDATEESVFSIIITHIVNL